MEQQGLGRSAARAKGTVDRGANVPTVFLILAFGWVINVSFGGTAGEISYPDLRTLPPSDIGIEYDPTTGRKLLRFSTTIANLGEGPLEVIPTNNATTGMTDAYQRLYSRDDQGNLSLANTAYIGTFVFHPEHDHWHLEDFARYELHGVAADGSVSGAVLASSEKVSFCMTDYEFVDAGLEHAGNQTYINCTPTDAQGISVGWSDIYAWNLEGQSLDITDLPDGDYWLVLTADPDNHINEGGGESESNNTGTFKVQIASELIWMDDALPAGATPGTANDSWTWVGSDPTPFSGSLAHQSDLGPGIHQHFFDFATARLALNPGNTLFVYVYLDPANPPSEIMLEWSDGYYSESRAYWGENLVEIGLNGTGSRRYMGPLPPLGQWVRLEVPVAQVDLASVGISGMSFTTFDGRATWDLAGVHFGPDLLPPTDTARPAVAVTSPTNHGTVSGVIRVTAEASDDLGVVAVQFQVDGADLGQAITKAPFWVSWDTSLTSDGPHLLTAVASDASGHSAASSPVSVSVRNHTVPTVVCPPAATLSCSPGLGLQAEVSVEVGNKDGAGSIAVWNVDGVDVQTNSVPPSGLSTTATISFAGVFTPGAHTVRVTVFNDLESASDETTVTVEADTTPPVISYPAEIVVPTDPGQCSALVDYPVTATDDCSGTTIVCQPPANSAFPQGTTIVDCTARDAAGNSSTCSFRVEVDDIEAPLVEGASANPSVLWPPDHGMVPITISACVRDNCGEPISRIIAITSNEPLDGALSADTTRAWEITGPLTVDLRAERSGGGVGRVYTIAIECEDKAGNRATNQVTVSVPLNPSVNLSSDPSPNSTRSLRSR